MKKFSFSLQILLDLKAQKELDARIQLGKAISKGEELAREISKRKSMILSTGLGSFGANLHAAEFYVHRLYSEKEKLEMQKQKNEEARKKAASDFVKARRELDAYEKLKEKKATEFHKIQNKNFEKQTDESNSVRMRVQGDSYGW